MVRTLKRHGRHGGHGAADKAAETVRTSEAGPDEQVERRAPDSPKDLPKRSWTVVLKGTLKEFKRMN
jgi:membrane protein